MENVAILIMGVCILIFYIIMSNGIRVWCEEDLGINKNLSDFLSTLWPITFVGLLFYSVTLLIIRGIRNG